MIRVVRNRLLQTIPALIGVTLVAFFLVNAGGDIASTLLPAEATAEQQQAFRERYGLDRPVILQYFTYIGQLIQGNFGLSFTYRRPALDVVLDAVPATVTLALSAMALSLAIAIPLGVLAARWRNTLFDRLAMGFVLVNQAVPAFWLGLILILVFAVNLGWFPVAGTGTISHLVLPSIALASWLMALVTRLVRASMLDVLGSDYVRTARAKGLSEVVVTVRHAMRNAFIPVITVVGIQLGALFGGAVVTETVFNWPGIGTVIYSAILGRDRPVVLAALIVVAVAYILINLVVDVIVGWLDPQVAE
jgi:peptide/nickel transport system permease protein